MLGKASLPFFLDSLFPPQVARAAILSCPSQTSQSSKHEKERQSVTKSGSSFRCSRPIREPQGLIGEALIDLAPLAEGRPVLAEWVTVEDATGRPAGKISVSARWLKPLRTGGDPGPHGLSSEEVEGLMARFSPEKDGQVCCVTLELLLGSCARWHPRKACARTQ